MKIVDIDSLFDEYIKEFTYKSIGVLKPEEIEDKIGELYIKFGDEKFKELDNKTPNTFYAEFSGEELINILKEHLENGVSVSDFLCEEIIKKAPEEELIKVLDSDNEELKAYAINMLNDLNSKKALSKYLELLFGGTESETVKELVAEYLVNYADDIKEKLLSMYEDLEKEEKLFALEILSKASKDDRVFSLLISEFLSGQNLLLLTAYLERYGDEKALPYLLNKIEDESINYQEFSELKMAIELFGGEYEKERDFSKDKIWAKIKEQAEIDSKSKKDLQN
ncbi:MAG: hypothetical protein E7342_01690 [Clostridiales bacterium]|nr:hypothetical protein [Clostridiales bacterium]